MSKYLPLTITNMKRERGGDASVASLMKAKVLYVRNGSTYKAVKGKDVTFKKYPRYEGDSHPEVYAFIGRRNVYARQVFKDVAKIQKDIIDNLNDSIKSDLEMIVAYSGYVTDTKKRLAAFQKKIAA